MQRTIVGRLPTGLSVFFAGVAGRALLVACTLVGALLLLDALFDGLAWALTRDRRALADAADCLTSAMLPLAVAVVGGHAREGLRRALEVKCARSPGSAPGGRRLGEQARPP